MKLSRKSTLNLVWPELYNKLEQTKVIPVNDTMDTKLAALNIG